LNILKKYWFVIIVAFLLVGLFAYVTYDENKGKLQGKKHNGQDVIFTIGDEIITAEMLYKRIKTDYADDINELLLARFEVMTLSQALPITKEMQKQAEEAVYSTVVAYFQYNYGEQYDYYLKTWMKQNNFVTLKDVEKGYTLPYVVVRPLLIKNYLESHLDEYFPDYLEKENPRLISHILVKMENPKEPTEEELAKIKEVEEALKTKSFAEVASEFSDDTGTAAKSGSLGIVDNLNKANYVPEFAEAAMLLASDEVSPWVVTSYGWHLIRNDGNTQEKLLTDANFYNNLTFHNENIGDKIVFDKAMELGTNFFGNDLLKQFITARFKEAE